MASQAEQLDTMTRVEHDAGSTSRTSLEANVTALAEAIRAGDQITVDRLLDDLTQIRDSALFREMGQVTRQLHEALTSFQTDSNLTELAEHQIPGARKDLDYVITMTEESAHKTLSAVETALPQAARLGERAQTMKSHWQRFQRREMQADEFRALAKEMNDFLADINAGTETISANLNEVMMAQGFQDLTGQIIRRVMTLVHDVEEQLVQVLRIRGSRFTAAATGEAVDSLCAEGPQADAEKRDDVVNDQDDVDDLLSSLGF